MQVFVRVDSRTHIEILALVNIALFTNFVLELQVLIHPVVKFNLIVYSIRGYFHLCLRELSFTETELPYNSVKDVDSHI